MLCVDSLVVESLASNQMTWVRAPVCALFYSPKNYINNHRPFFYMGIIIKSNVKKSTDLSVSEEFLIEFEKQAEELMKKAEKRARDNFRRTLFARDL